MNELIRKIEVQAWEQVVRTNGLVRTEDFNQKFAELLIKECARVARATPAPNFPEHLKNQLGHTWDMAALEAGREVVKHFGME